MTRRTQLALLLVGLAGFALIVARAGPARLAREIGEAGWVLVPVVLVYVGVYLASSEAWRLTMGDAARRMSTLRAFALTSWGYALNFVTPFVSVGGEPFKIAAASQWLGARTAAATVLGQRLLHAEAHVMFFLTGLVLAVALLPRGEIGIAVVAALALAFLLLGTLLVTVHRRGGAERLLDLVVRLPVVRRHAHRLEARRPALVEVDERITEFVRANPRRFVLALGLEYAGRCLSVVELMLIAHALDVPVGYWTAYLIAAAASLSVNLFFFIPFALGAREGGLAAIFAALGLPPELGVATSVIGRVREITWIGIGLLLGALAVRPGESANGQPGRTSRDPGGELASGPEESA